MRIVFLAGIFLVIIAYEVPGLIKNKEWRELAAFSGLMMVAMAMSFAEALNLPFPNPNTGLKMIFTPVTSLIYKMFT